MCIKQMQRGKIECGAYKTTAFPVAIGTAGLPLSKLASILKELIVKPLMQKCALKIDTIKTIAVSPV